ncbi:MAG: Na/Pi symporter [Gammaproteobacteria bacterium]|nr:Na/Pi symporter [Gammaproteobacteria bacterium]
MTEQFDLWRALAGLGLFLFAMSQLEDGLRGIGGRGLANFLKQRTDTPLKAVTGGTIATALLQSSSVVGLMVLAFVGAGLLALPNALGVVFGANLGTTFTGWIVAALGLKLDIEELALPLIAGGALLLLVGRERMAHIGRVTLGLALLLLGLQFMKDSVAALQATVDVAALEGLAPWQYLAFGTLFAAIIRSSSATMMVTLAALDGGVINLPNAAAIAIGADLGTTFTVLMGAIQGSGSKRQVASGHFIFNLVTDAIAFALRLPLLGVVAWLGIEDPLYSLVAFHSLFNIMGLVIFVPIIKPFARWLERFGSERETSEAQYVREMVPEVSDAALAAIEQETAHLIARVVRQNMQVFSPPLPLPPGELPVDTNSAKDSELAKFDAMYDGTKRLEGEILRFATQLQRQPLNEAESRRLSQLLSAVREAVHSTKQLKDIRHNLEEFEDAPGPRINVYLDHFRSVMNSYFTDLFALRRAGQPHPRPEDIVELIQDVHGRHDQMHSEIYADISSGAVPEAVASSLLNVNREVLNSNLSLLSALTDYHLEPERALDLKRLPRTT